MIVQLPGVLLLLSAFCGSTVYASPTGHLAATWKGCSIEKHPDVVSISSFLYETGSTQLTLAPKSDLLGTTYISHVRTASLPSGNKYRYVHYTPKSQNQSTVVFLHGFPSSSYDWRYQIPYLVSKGYGVLAPDLLGYGGTSKPNDPGAYTLKKQATDIVKLLDCVGAKKVVSVGHDL